jgi:hypothetical protein
MLRKDLSRAVKTGLSITAELSISGALEQYIFGIPYQEANKTTYFS